MRRRLLLVAAAVFVLAVSAVLGLVPRRSAATPPATATPAATATVAPTQTSAPTVTQTPAPQPSPLPAEALAVTSTSAMTVPTRLVISRGDKIIVDSEVVSMGLDERIRRQYGRRAPATHDYLATWYKHYCGAGVTEDCRTLFTGHRWSEGAEFNRLPDVKVGDTMIIETETHRCTYRVVESGEIADSDISHIGRNRGMPVVTAMTCAGETRRVNGTLIASLRWVVEATLIGCEPIK